MFELIPFGRTNRAMTYDPFRMFDDMERSFFSGNHATAFRTDVIDTGDAYRLESELPGFNKEDISIDLKDGILTITATHNESSDQKGSDGSYIRREPRYGSFARSFDVTGIDERGITAAYNNGVLSLTLPKFKPAEPETHRIAIQ